MTTRILLDPDGSAILVETGSYLLWEPEFPIQVAARQKVYVFPQDRAMAVAARGSIHVAGSRASIRVARSRGSVWVPPRSS